jgi:acyl carrier protein
MKNKFDKKIKRIMATVFETNIEMITDDASPHNIKNWDSLKHIKLIIALEDEFNIKLEVDEINVMVKFSIISAYIHAQLN